MAAILSPGIGTGLDVNGLVTRLVAAERAPTEQRITADERETRAEISAFGALAGALSGLQAALKAFDGTGSAMARKATVQSGAGFTASASPEAAPGRYSVRVEALASTHKLRSAPVDADTQVGYGTLSIAVGSDPPITVPIAQGAGTLSAIRDAINTAAGDGGVRATLVRGDAGDVLVLTSPRAGGDGALTISASGGDGGLSVLATSGGTMSTVAPAANAEVWVDGVQRTAPGNRLTDLVDGLTIELTAARPGETFSLDVAADPGSLREKMDRFIASYNAAIVELRKQTANGGNGAPAAALAGDAAPRAISRQLRAVIGNGYDGLSRLGIKTAVDGTLSLDGGKFDGALAADPGAVKALFHETATLGDGLRDALAGAVGSDGLIAARTGSLNQRLTALDAQRTTLDRRMAEVEARYRRQFATLDAMVSQLQSTSSFLSRQLAALEQ